MDIPGWLSDVDFAAVTQLALDTLRDLGNEESQGVLLKRAESGGVRAYLYQASAQHPSELTFAEVELSNETRMVAELVFNSIAFQAFTLRTHSARVYKSSETGSTRPLQKFINDLNKKEAIRFEFHPDAGDWRLWISHSL